MSDNKVNNKIDAEHGQMEALIPWYVNGTLSAAEGEAVEKHIAECEPCHNEVLRCQSLTGHLPAPAEIWQPTAAHFAGILAEVDRLETVSPKPSISQPIIAAPGFFQRMGAWLSQTPRPVRWALAIETLACAALALFVLFPHAPISGSGGVFETLTDSGRPVATKASSIRLVFSEDMTTRELFELLKQAKAQIRQGPSEVGSYLVEVAPEDETRTLSLLRAHPKVQLAQTIH